MCGQVSLFSFLVCENGVYKTNFQVFGICSASEQGCGLSEYCMRRWFDKKTKMQAQIKRGKEKILWRGMD